MVGFIAKPNIFVSLRGAQRRGNLKVIDVESRSEARQQGTTKFRIGDPSRSDTTSASSPEAPFHAGASPHFSVRSIFHTVKDRISRRSHTRLKDEFHCAALAVLRSGMPSRSVKDCRVGRKKCALLAMTNLIGFAGKRNGFQNETFENGAGQHRAKMTA